MTEAIAARLNSACAALDAQSAAEARREALESEVAQTRDKALSEAQKAAQDAHRRLLGLAGTPTFDAEPDMEKFNNISRIVTDWRLIREEKATLAAERQAFDADRDAALGRHGQELRQQIDEAREEIARLRDTARDLHRQLGVRSAFTKLTTGTSCGIALDADGGGAGVSRGEVGHVHLRELIT